MDNELETPVIKAVLYVGRDAVYRDNETASFGYFPGKTNTAQAAEKGGNGEYFNFYGSRDVGIIADKYDDFSFKEKDEETGSMKPNPEYLQSNNARSFLNFGITPDESTPDGVEGKWYEQEIDGKVAKRVIYMPFSNHGGAVFVSAACTDAVEFMTTVFGTESTLTAGAHIYPLKTVGNLMGFVGFFMFLACMALLLVQYEPFSGASAGENAVMRQAGDQKEGKLWLGGCLLANTVFPLLSVLILFHFKVDKVVNGFFMQGMPLFMVAYVTASVFINCLNFNTSFGKTEKKNIVVLSLLNILSPFILAALGYGYFLATGVNSFYGTNNQISDWMVPPLLLLFITPFITRAIYRKTKNPYLGGIINAVIVTIMTCVNAQIVFPT